MSRKRTITVSCEFPNDAEDGEIATFVEEALSTWGGQRHPDDPLFDSLKVHTVKIGNTTYTMEPANG